MAQVTVYADEGVSVDVQAGGPPVDQSAQVARLQADVAKLQGKLDALAVNAQARKDADAAKVDGQDDLDIING